MHSLYYSFEVMILYQKQPQWFDHFQLPRVLHTCMGSVYYLDAQVGG